MHACVRPNMSGSITPTSMDGFQNYLTQLLSFRKRSAILNVLDR